jgi:hypothetical protein
VRNPFWAVAVASWIGAASTFWATNAAASPIAVPNFSFEDPDLSDGTDNGALAQSASSWDELVLSAGSAGLHDPQNGSFAGATGNPGTTSLPGTADAHQYAWVNVNSGQTGAFRSASDLAVIQAGSTYTLTVALGDRLEIEPGSVSIQLLAYDGVLFTTAATAATTVFSEGTFVDLSTVFSTLPSGDPLVGQGLRVLLSHTHTGGGAGTQQSAFDNVRVDVVVPEPASIALICSGLAAMAAARRVALRR